MEHIWLSNWKLPLRSHVNKTETLGALLSDQCRRTYLEQHPLPLSPSTFQILKISYTNSMRG